jgi:hypothetical protein
MTGTPGTFDPNAPLGSLSDLGTTPAAQPTTEAGTGLDGVGETTETGQSLPQAGEVVLPETITDINPLDVAAPVTGDVPIDSTVPAGDVPVDVAPPGEATAPSLGNLPSDSSIDIAPPESLEAEVPPIDSVPSPLEVAPPEGWTPDTGEDSGIGVFDDSFGADKAACNYRGTCTPEDLDEAEKRYQDEQKGVVGKDVTEADVENDKDRIIGNLSSILPELGDAIVADQVNDIYNSLEGLSPYEKLIVMRELERQVLSEESFGRREQGFAGAGADILARVSAESRGDGDFPGNTLEDRKFAVAMALGIDTDLLLFGSPETQQSLLDFYFSEPDALPQWLKALNGGVERVDNTFALWIPDQSGLIPDVPFFGMVHYEWSDGSIRYRIPLSSMAFGSVIDSGGARVAGIGFADDAVRSAFIGMNRQGGHAIRKLEALGYIPQTGNLASRVKAFEKFVTPILTSPTHSFDYKVGKYWTRGFAQKIDNQWLAVFVAKEGPYQGKVVTAFFPDPNQIVIMGLK